jgi:hypothetical protein
MLQPTTKALAQMLAGNTRVSGQLVHARNVLGQAQRLVEERAVERLPPAQREEFLEQLARLKLTLIDADELEPVDHGDTAGHPPAVPVAVDRLRDVARRLATSGSPEPPPTPLPSVEMMEDEPAPADGADIGEVGNPLAGEPERGDRLRLRMATAGGPEPIRARERLRLRSTKPAAGTTRD